jgi:hypothetical protein
VGTSGRDCSLMFAWYHRLVPRLAGYPHSGSGPFLLHTDPTAAIMFKILHEAPGLPIPAVCLFLPPLRN